MMDSSFTEGFLTGQNSSNNGANGMGMWGAESWWFIIVLFALWGGFGGNGWGGGGNNAGTQGALTRGDLCMDMSFNDLQNGVRNINDAVNLGFSNLNSTICHQSYENAMLINGINNNINGVTAAVNGGFSALNSTICQNAYENAGLINGLNNTIQGGFNAANIVALQNQNALQAQLNNCCCNLERGLDSLNYNMATNTCAIQNTIQNTTRDMIDTNNANTRAILDKLTAQEIAAKDAQITGLNQQLFTANLAASQNQQTAQIEARADARLNQVLNAINPPAVPAYPAPSPCGLGNWSAAVLANGYGYGYNNGCGCGCGCGC